MQYDFGNGSIIAEYLRMSREDEKFGESYSIGNQRKLIADYIVSRSDLNCKKAVEFIDDGYTGVNFSRPAAAKMFGMAKCGEMGCIIVKVEIIWISDDPLTTIGKTVYKHLPGCVYPGRCCKRSQIFFET